MEMAPGPENNRDRPVENNTESNEIENEELPNFVINVSDEDSDEEFNDEDTMGYSLIPQDPEDVMDSDDVCSDSEINSNEEINEASGQNNSTEVPSGIPSGIDYESLGMPKPTYLEIQDLPKPDKKSLLWNQPRQIPAMHPGLDSGAADKIKKAMCGFQLPVENIPNWAKSLSDDQWKEHVDKIKSPQKDFDVEMEQDLS